MKTASPRGTGVHERLREAREVLGKSQTAMASAIGVAARTYTRAEAGERALTEGEIIAIGRLGIDLNWLLEGRGTIKRSAGLTDTAAALPPTLPGVSDGDFVLVPRYDIQASAGPGAFNDEEQIVDWLAFSRTWVRSTLRVDPKWLVLLSAIGDSMEPTIRDDAIYVLQIDGQLMVKRVQRFFTGAVVVKSDNSKSYVEQTLSKDEAAGAQVAGRVRWIGRMI